MKTTIAAAVIIINACAASAYAGFNVNVDIGVPVQPAPAPVIVAPPPPPPAPVYQAPPEIVFETAPRFIYSPTLGFYVSVESPYDVMYIGDRYYVFNGGYWYASPYYNGPWVVVKKRMLPPGLRRHRYEEIRRYRDVEYRTFVRDRDRYRGKWYAPPEHRREERREHIREEKREHREERREQEHERHEEHRDWR
ncbi:YXWGXW repeat-containing protein [Geomesophilobacter sediminis]|uniref:YXWGXW repeat-containing protein n=1 Tax=Geomesophilobacter sediminis TaxID=2798584 RepID=A0A8J7M3I5_9BACT|nr:YXWGXW repeat-containing protein [Geomesophilobacter sediminis]MBJ6727914.1 YXWGXW repeat-containing protein [Geomesophilobacter sediminis]